MSGLETTIASAVSDVLIDDLNFTPKPGASYILNKTCVRHQPAGSNIYNPNTGTKVIRLNLTADSQSWLNPQSCRLMFDIVNGDTTKPLQLLTGPWSLFNRLDVRLAGTQVESLSNYGRLMTMLQRSLTHHARIREIDLGVGGHILESGQEIVD